jgi:hypothetical protein
VTATTTTALNILKVNYTGTRLEYLTYKNRPWWGMIKKKEGFGGRSKPIPVTHAGPGGRSKVFATARTNRSGARYEAFDLTRARDYMHFSLDTEAMLASKNDSDAFESLVKSEASGALTKISESLSRGLFGNRGASVGVIGSGTGTPTLTLSRLSDVVNFEVGDVLVSDATNGESGSPDAGSGIIGAVDRDAGTITQQGGGNWAAAFGDGDFLFIEGDHGAGFAGLDSWLPAAAPTIGDDFFGVDRGQDPTRLAGIRYVAAGGDVDITGALINASGRVMTNGGMTDLVVVNPINFTSIINEAVVKTNLDKAMPMRGYDKMPAHLGYSGIQMALASGSNVKVVPDKHCPLNVAYMLESETWCFHSLNKAPFLFDEDGQLYDREEDADAITARYNVFGNLACSAPGKNARVNIAAVA